jgi:pimeloyl-ACP methyl ester carboxylesterase
VQVAIAVTPRPAPWQAGQALPAGGPPAKTASWSLGGQPLPWVPMHGEKLMGQMLRHSLFDRFARHPKPAALEMLPAFEPGLKDADAVAAATIPVERIAGPLMVVAGGDDEMWPSVTMANAIATRRRDAGVGDDDVVLVFEHAGHFIRPPGTPTTVPWNDSLVSGGDPAAIAVAQTETWAKMLTFLRRT